MSDFGGILVYIELDRNLNIIPVSLELLSKSVELSKKLENKTVSALVIGECDDYAPIIQTLKETGADNVIIAQDDRLKEYITQNYSKTACRIINEKKPEIVLIGATCQGRDLAPRISTTLNTGLTADCTGLDINEDGKLAATRPTFGGQLMATILCKTYPQMATVRPNTFKIIPCLNENTTAEYTDLSNEEFDNKIELINFVKKFKTDTGSLSDCEIVVGCGKGIATEKGIELAKELAKELKAGLGASRAAVETGAFSQSSQVGQTGSTITPKLYIACGISGAVQHIVGIENSEKIIAINKDENAPIFKSADYGIVGDFYEIAPHLIRKIQELNKGNYDA